MHWRSARPAVRPPARMTGSTSAATIPSAGRAGRQARLLTASELTGEARRIGTIWQIIATDDAVCFRSERALHFLDYVRNRVEAAMEEGRARAFPMRSPLFSNPFLPVWQNGGVTGSFLALSLFAAVVPYGICVACAGAASAPLRNRGCAPGRCTAAPLTGCAAKSRIPFLRSTVASATTDSCSGSH